MIFSRFKNLTLERYFMAVLQIFKRYFPNPTDSNRGGGKGQLLVNGYEVSVVQDG